MQIVFSLCVRYIEYLWWLFLYKFNHLNNTNRLRRFKHKIGHVLVTKATVVQLNHVSYQNAIHKLITASMGLMNFSGDPMQSSRSVGSQATTGD